MLTSTGNQWIIDAFQPMEAIPNGVYLTKYGGGPREFLRMPLNDMLKQIQAGKLHVQVGQTFHIDEIVQAHQTMDKNIAHGKIVVLT